MSRRLRARKGIAESVMLASGRGPQDRFGRGERLEAWRGDIRDDGVWHLSSAGPAIGEIGDQCPVSGANIGDKLT
jgi:hypothetical protein